MFLLIVFVWLSNCFGEFVEIFETRVYANSPSIPIRGKGLDQASIDDISMLVVLKGYHFFIMLRRDYHYSLSKVSYNELSMNLLSEKNLG